MALHLNRDQTPRMTNHARARCLEMGVSTKVPKAILRTWATIRPSRPGPGHQDGDRYIVKSDEFPGYAVCAAQDADGTVWVLSLLFDPGHGRTYVRTGPTYAIQEN